MAQKKKTEKSSVKAEPIKTNSSKPKKRRIWLWVLISILAVIILTISVFAVGIYGFKWQNKPTQVMAKIIPYPTALIADQYFPYISGIRISTLWNEMNSVEKYFKEFQKLDLSQKDNKDQYDMMRYQIQQQLIDNKIINQIARSYGVKIDQKQIDEEYKKIVDANGGEAKVKETIEKYYGWNVEQFKEKIREYLLRQELEKKVNSDDKLNADAKKKAEDVLAEVKKDLNKFAELAKKYSQDEQSAQQGGELGKFTKGKMVPEFENAAFALKPGEVSGIVKTEYGYHIIQVEANDGNEVQARHILIKTKSFSDWLFEQKKNAKIWAFYKEPQKSQQSQPQIQQQTQQ